MAGSRTPGWISYSEAAAPLRPCGASAWPSPCPALPRRGPQGRGSRAVPFRFAQPGHSRVRSLEVGRDPIPASWCTGRVSPAGDFRVRADAAGGEEHGGPTPGGAGGRTWASGDDRAVRRRQKRRHLTTINKRSAWASDDDEGGGDGETMKEAGRDGVRPSSPEDMFAQKGDGTWLSFPPADAPVCAGLALRAVSPTSTTSPRASRRAIVLRRHRPPFPIPPPVTPPSGLRAVRRQRRPIQAAPLGHRGPRRRRQRTAPPAWAPGRGRIRGSW